MKKRKPNWSRIIPAFLGLVMIIIIFVIAIKLIIWSRGQKIVITEEDIAGIKMDTSDNITILPASIFRPDTDDGVPTIAVFGNDSYYAGLDDKSSITDLINEEIPEAVIYNFCLPGSQLTSISTESTSPEECPEDYFTFFWMILNKKLDALQNQYDALNYLDQDKYDLARYSEVLTAYDALDMNTVDLILICYDGHEYINGVVPESEEKNDFEVSKSTTVIGSLSTSIYIMNAGYPDIQYVYLSPVFCYAKDENGKRVDCDKYDTGNGTISAHLNAAKGAQNVVGLSYIDLFSGVDINDSNADSYLEADGITPNKKARQLIAERVSKLLSERL